MTYHNPFRVLVQEGFLYSVEMNVVHLDGTRFKKLKYFQGSLEICLLQKQVCHNL